MYVKFAEDCEPIHHFGTCIGGNNPSTPWPSVRAGQPTLGDKSFWTQMNHLVPNGNGTITRIGARCVAAHHAVEHGAESFIHNDSLKVHRGKWTCIEVMAKMNDVGDTTGELALWVDGQAVRFLGKGFPTGKWTFDKFYPSMRRR